MRMLMFNFGEHIPFVLLIYPIHVWNDSIWIAIEMIYSWPIDCAQINISQIHGDIQSESGRFAGLFIIKKWTPPTYLMVCVLQAVYQKWIVPYLSGSGILGLQTYCTVISPCCTLRLISVPYLRWHKWPIILHSMLHKPAHHLEPQACR